MAAVTSTRTEHVCQVVRVLFSHRDTSGQGRFCTIFRSYSRGAQVRHSGNVSVLFCRYSGMQPLFLLVVYFLKGILLVYDITNGWSFDGIDRWIREIDEVVPVDTFPAYKGKNME